MGKVNCVHQPYHRPAAMLLGKGDRSPSLSPGAPYHHAHRMAVGLEVQSEEVEGDRLGDVVTFCLGSPGLLNIINSRFSSNNRVTPSIDLPPWRFSPYL